MVRGGGKGSNKEAKDLGYLEVIFRMFLYFFDGVGVSIVSFRGREIVLVVSIWGVRWLWDVLEVVRSVGLEFDWVG